jgi:hypothetical protein
VLFEGGEGMDEEGACLVVIYGQHVRLFLRRVT